MVIKLLLTQPAFARVLLQQPQSMLSNSACLKCGQKETTPPSTTNRANAESTATTMMKYPADATSRLVVLCREAVHWRNVACRDDGVYRQLLQRINEIIRTARRQRRNPAVTAELNLQQQVLRSWLAYREANFRAAHAEFECAQNGSIQDLIVALEQECAAYRETLPTALWQRIITTVGWRTLNGDTL